MSTGDLAFPLFARSHCGSLSLSEFQYLLEESRADGAKSPILENSGFYFITNLIDLIEQLYEYSYFGTKMY